MIVFFLCNLDYINQTIKNENIYWTWLGGVNITRRGPTFEWIDGSEGKYLLCMFLFILYYI